KISGWQESVDAVPVSATPDPGHDEVVIPIDTAQGERWIAIAGVEFFGGTVYAFRDLTGVRELEEMKADFIATASHELRTPLAAVYGAAQTLLRHDFAKFYRLDPQMTRGVGGTGLGLYICNELVTRMGGHIWVESVTGEGSTFLFELPAAAAAAQGTATPNGRLTRSSEFDL